MWKIYKHAVTAYVFLVEPDGHEHKITTDGVIETDFYYTVEDRDADGITKKAAFDKGNNHIKRFWVFSEAVAKCAILNS
jgi:hypothetical protein